MANGVRQLRKIYAPGSSHWVGDGFPVRNFFPSHDIFDEVSPFLLLDYAGPRYFEPSSKPHGVGEHPHRGFETVTLLYQGEVEHRDSAGNSGTLRAGDVQWMTAASGVVHEEMHGKNFAAAGGVFEAIQLWVNLPAKNKMDSPRYQDIGKAEIPQVEAAPGIALRVIAGDFQGIRGPAQTYTPVNLWDIHMGEASTLDLQVPSQQNLLLFLRSGGIILNGHDKLSEARLAVYSAGDGGVALKAEADSQLLAMAGAPIDEPIVQRGPFVMNTLEQIQQAIIDYQTGRMGHL